MQRQGGTKTIDDALFTEIVNNNGFVVGYVRALFPIHAEASYADMINDSHIVQELNSDIAKLGDEMGELHYQLTHPKKDKK